MCDGITDSYRYADERKRKEEFSRLLLEALTPSNSNDATTNNAATRLLNERFSEDWAIFLQPEQTPKDLLALLRDADHVAWGRLLGITDQNDHWWEALKELSPFRDCVAIVCGHFAGGSRVIHVDAGRDLDRFVESRVREEKVPNVYGYKYVLFLPLTDVNTVPVFIGQRPRVTVV